MSRPGVWRIRKTLEFRWLSLCSGALSLVCVQWKLSGNADWKLETGGSRGPGADETGWIAQPPSC